MSFSDDNWTTFAPLALDCATPFRVIYSSIMRSWGKTKTRTFQSYIHTITVFSPQKKLDRPLVQMITLNKKRGVKGLWGLRL